MEETVATEGVPVYSPAEGAPYDAPLFGAG